MDDFGHRYNADFDLIAEMRNALPELLMAASECDAYKARAEALERALRGNCFMCKHSKVHQDGPGSWHYECIATPEDIDGDTKVCSEWEFDEERFAQEEQPT